MSTRVLPCPSADGRCSAPPPTGAAVLTIGATIVDGQRRPDGTGWVVMGDPEGNEFCVERGTAERAA